MNDYREMKQVKLSDRQVGLVGTFMQAINEGDYQKFWELISNESKGYLQGAFDKIKRRPNDSWETTQHKEFFTLYIPAIINNVKKGLGDKWLKDSGISNKGLYYDELKVAAKLVANHKTVVHYVSPIEIEIYAIPMVRELTKINDNQEIVIDWKIDFISFYKVYNK